MQYVIQSCQLNNFSLTFLSVKISRVHRVSRLRDDGSREEKKKKHVTSEQQGGSAISVGVVKAKNARCLKVDTRESLATREKNREKVVTWGDHRAGKS